MSAFKRKTRDGDVVTFADLYPRAKQPREELEAAAGTLVKVIDKTFELLANADPSLHHGKEDTFLVDKTKLVTFGMDAIDPTAERKDQHQPIKNKDVLDLLRHVTVPEFVRRIRVCLTLALKTIVVDEKITVAPTQHGPLLSAKFELPKYGTGLSMVYRQLEDRLQARVAFDCTEDARRVVALARSLDKLACSDWSEMGANHALSNAMLVRKASHAVSDTLKAEIVSIVKHGAQHVNFYY